MGSVQVVFVLSSSSLNFCIVKNNKKHICNHLHAEVRLITADEHCYKLIL